MGMEPVHLHEADEDVVEAAPAARGSHGRRRRARPRWLGLAAAGVVVCLVAVSLLTRGSSGGDNAGRLAEYPAFVAGLTEPPQVRWSSATAGVPAAVVGDRVLAQQHLGTMTVTAHGLESGELVWSATPGGAPSGFVRCAWSGVGEGLERALMACLVDRDTAPWRLLALDTATGDVVQEVEIPLRPAELAVWDGTAVVVGVQNGSEAVALGFDLATGQQRWNSGALGEVAPSQRLVVLARHGRIAVGWADQVRLLDTAGAVLERWQASDPEARLWLEIRGDGALVAFDGRLQGTASRTTLLPGTGARPTEFPGRVVMPLVDDGSLDDLVLLTQSEMLVAWRTEDRRRLWAVPTSARTAVVGQGRVVTVRLGDVIAHAGRDGQIVWRTPLSLTGVSLLAADAEVVQVLAADVTGEQWLVALRAHDGAELWRSALGQLQVGSVLVVDGHLFVSTDGQLVRVR